MGSTEAISLDQELPLVTKSDVLAQALLYKINSRFNTRGEVLFPCLPSLLDYYKQWFDTLFNALGKPLSPEKQDELHKLLVQKLEDGFRFSPSSMLLLQYESMPPPEMGLKCKLAIVNSTLTEQYKGWLETRQPPLFGGLPDAKIMDLLGQLGDPAGVRILDIGAGPGRNTLPLARLGYQVDAIELTSSFTEQLRLAADSEKLNVNVIHGDVLDPLVRLQTRSYQLAFASEVVSHFRELDQVKLLLAKISDLLPIGGLFLFSSFVNVGDYQPDQMVREAAQMAWSSVFDRVELLRVIELLPLNLISDELVFDYERNHLPSEAWPQTPWFPNWSTGKDIFPLVEGRPPIELRWFLCQRI